MSKTRCKALRKDGEPCQGLGQEQFGGYCIAHAPSETAWEWRSKGGKASSAVARADKRMPDRLRGAIEMLTKGMEDLAAGKIEPAALSAMSRAARVLVNLYRLADEEMDLIRDEETAVVAAQIAGGYGDPALIEKAEAIAAWQNQYMLDALLKQELVSLDRENTQKEDAPPKYVLTTAGRQRFRYQRLTTFTQEDIDQLRELAGYTDTGGEQLPLVLIDLYKMRTNLEELLTDFAPGSPPVLDPLSGQTLNQLPTGVRPAAVPVAGPGESAQIAKTMQDMLLQVNELFGETGALYEKQFGEPFEIRHELQQED
ncbi:MAG: hypothetical protein OXJ55_16650 [Caldilineaceae bacterium]|nr:hypothetical protein [Caldilineaceae bacterium]MDE0465254.1 hypothetical protein [Caldilineaceae bacterium]